ncbi:TniQ family protein [Lentibacillus sediminis]|uniref:TniQ family protein n=1 Tax=Lentibacillus sediminis TaxID=1940529 RepID=UPI000C1BA890|nr:TniQ family protein [Lentibacillus sediminis]
MGNQYFTGSLLYNLEPIEINTAHKESLSSYMSRLAVAHNVSQGLLFSKVITPQMNKEYLTNIAAKGGNGFYDSSSGINGIGTMANDFVNVMSTLTTRTDLRDITLIKCSKIIPTRGLMREKKAWCPVCFHVALNEGKTIYEQLLWNIKVVKICPIHQILLEQQCTYCLKKMQILSRNSRPGYCDNCGGWLGKELVKKLESNALEEEINITKQVMNLITHNSSNIIHRKHISESLQYYVQNEFEGNINKAAEVFGVARTTFRYWYKGINIPELKTLILICNKLDITVIGFFHKKPANINKNLISGITVEKKSKKKLDHEYIKNYLNNYIHRDYITAPKSIKKIASVIGCDRRLLYLKYPNETRKINEIYVAHIKERKRNRLLKAELELSKSVDALQNDNIYPSRRKVELLLKGSYLVREKGIATTWKKLINSKIKDINQNVGEKQKINLEN